MDKFQKINPETHTFDYSKFESLFKDFRKAFIMYLAR